MARRAAVQLIDALDWRVKTLRYLNLYAGSEEGEPSVEEIRTCMGMMILEMATILEQSDGEQREDLGDEGPLGPLPPGVFDAKTPRAPSCPDARGMLSGSS